MCVTNSSFDEDAFVAARRLAIFGEDTPPLDRPERTRAYWSHGRGWNYRSHELSAALARSQLRRLDDYIATAQRNAAILTAGLAELPGFEPPHVPEDRTCVYYRYRIRLLAAELGFGGPPLEFRDRVLDALRGEGVAADVWQLLPLPAQPVFRGGPHALRPWDPGEYPEVMRLLEGSVVLGTAEHPIFCQPPDLMERYVEAFKKLVESIDVVLTADYRPLEPWPPREPPL